jgi:predicted nucleotidyltransferase
MKTLADIALRPGDRAAIDEAARVLRERFPVEEVILFGSKARGDDDPESDIDLLVLTSRQLARAERHQIVDALFPIQLHNDVVLSPLIVYADEWRGGVLSVLPIRQEVDQQGAAA